MSKPWAIGDWAAEAERAEEEENARLAAEAAAAAAFAPIDDASSTRANSLPGKTRSKKQTFSISEFTTGRSVSHGTRVRDNTASPGFVPPQAMVMLPTGPRDRSGEQDHYIGLGGAFQNHRGGGNYRGVPDRFGDEPEYGRLGNDRMVSGLLHDRVQNEPSRADGSSDWSSSKKVILSRAGASGGDRKSLPEGEKRVQRLGHSEPLPSRADGVDNWGLAKRSLPLGPAESRPARRNDDSRQLFCVNEADNWTTSKKTVSPPGTEVTHAQSCADEATNWLSTKTMSMGLRDGEPRPPADRAKTVQLHQRAAEDLRRNPVVSTPQTQLPSSSPDATSSLPPPRPKPKSNPFGSARPREEVLANRDPDDQNQIGTKDLGRPSSNLSSRPITPETSGELAVKPRPKVNPFGNAKPREVLLQERGKDWRKMDFDLEHRAVERLETQEEIALREEIRVLTELSKQKEEACSQKTNGYAPDPSVRQDTRLHLILEDLRIKERQLQELTLTLDDKVRFSQKFVGMAGPQAGRSDLGRRSETFGRPGSRPSSRPGSRSGRSDTGINYDFTERLEPRRTFDASDQTYLLSEYGSWAGSGQVANFRENTMAPERMGSWSGHKASRGFEPSERRDWQSAVSELGTADKYSQQAGGPDVWTRSNDGSHERPTSWRGQERGYYRGGEGRLINIYLPIQEEQSLGKWLSKAVAENDISRLHIPLAVMQISFLRPRKEFLRFQGFCYSCCAESLLHFIAVDMILSIMLKRELHLKPHQEIHKCLWPQIARTDLPPLRTTYK
ncbi:hypothetical protein GOP47_0008660 [Adiantum capillus-veneris]|uniref:Uncharacterized protein n=1 Tax=Adiantum capillus-veneris TaxID=13818 RepID=A0A9D4UZE5_ADICA|nr:hypothetical protein GOP47_0008660 [Adiantum capillus-veneris]